MSIYEESKISKILLSLFFLFLGISLGILIAILHNPQLLELGSASNSMVQQQSIAMSAKPSVVSVPIVAVDASGKGIVGTAKVELRSGSGRVLFVTNPFVEPDTQYSFETAKQVAELISGKKLDKYDIIYTIKAANAKLVGGPSAGAAICIATIALLENKKLASDFAVTGTIEEDGSIGKVAGIFEKAEAAAEAGYKYFFVPKGQSKLIVYERKEEVRKGFGFIFKRIYYVPKLVDLNEEMYRKYNMQVIEVSNIIELANYVLK